MRSTACSCDWRKTRKCILIIREEKVRQVWNFMVLVFGIWLERNGGFPISLRLLLDVRMHIKCCVSIIYAL